MKSQFYIEHTKTGIEENKQFQSISTRTALDSPPERFKENPISRVQSANEIILLSMEEDGPKPNQKTRAITTNMDSNLGIMPKKDKFYIYVDSDLDDKYKGIVNCGNPVALRKQRRKIACLPGFAETFKGTQILKENIKENNILQNSNELNELKENMNIPKFNFEEYMPLILGNFCANTYFGPQKRSLNLTLPIPEAFFGKPKGDM